MSSAYESCIDDSPRYQAELETQLNNQKSTDVVTHYENVARAFPSIKANPYSFEIPLIDHEACKEWAANKGWFVKLAPEVATQSNAEMPPVRFTKRP